MRYKEVKKMANTNVSTFKLNPVDTAGTSLTGTRALYANGNQQVKLRVTIRKQVDGSDQNLSPSEIDSLDIASLDGSSLPAKWKSTDKANDYTMGLRSAQRAMKVDVIEVEENVKSGDQTFYFYVSTSDTHLEPMDFEAVVKIGDTVYRSGSSTYSKSFITIQAHAPAIIQVNELTRSTEDEHVRHTLIDDNDKDADSNYDLYAVYWFIPDDIELRAYTLVDQMHQRTVENCSNYYKSNTSKALSLLQHGVTNFEANAFGLHYYNVGADVTIPDYPNAIRITWCKITNFKDATTYSNEDVRVAILDEYGTTSKYNFRMVNPAENDDIEILAAN